MRQYIDPINMSDPDECIFTVSEWENDIKDKICFNDHGCGYWVKDSMASRDEVFSTEALDATHVIWYNK